MIRQTLFLLALSLCPVLADRLPPDALELKGKRDAKVAEIDRAYAAALDKLQKKAMESGNLSAANEIQKEIERVTKNPFVDVSIEGNWDVEFVGLKTVKRKITKTHVIDETGGKHAYTIEGNSIHVPWGGDLWEKIEIDRANPSVMSGINNGGTKIIYRKSDKK